jgi:hypothetical protein
MCSKKEKQLSCSHTLVCLFVSKEMVQETLLFSLFPFRKTAIQLEFIVLRKRIAEDHMVLQVSWFISRNDLSPCWWSKCILILWLHAIIYNPKIVKLGGRIAFLLNWKCIPEFFTEKINSVLIFYQEFECRIPTSLNIINIVNILNPFSKKITRTRHHFELSSSKLRQLMVAATFNQFIWAWCDRLTA